MGYKVEQLWMPEYLYAIKAPYSMVPEGIVSHNTAGTASAREEATAMINRKGSGASTSFHVIADENGILELVPFNRNCWHGGDGVNGYANRHLIGLEIARSMSDKELYLKAEDNAAQYIANVLYENGWGVDRVFKHKQFANTACPHRTEELGWDRYIAKIQGYLNQLKQGKLPNNQPVKNENMLKVNLHGWTREIPGEIKDGKAYVAIRDLLDQMGYEISWKDGVIEVTYK